MDERSIAIDSVYFAHHGDVSCDIQCRDKHAPVLVVLESPWHLEQFLQRPATGRTGAILCSIFESVRGKLPSHFKELAPAFCTREVSIINVVDDYLPFKYGLKNKRMTAKEFIDSNSREYSDAMTKFKRKLEKSIDVSRVQIVLLMGQLSWKTSNCFPSTSIVVELYHPSYVGRRSEFGDNVVMRTMLVAEYILYCLRHASLSKGKFSIEQFKDYIKKVKG